MALTGKLSIEIGIQAPPAKWFNLFTNQLHNVQNVTEKVHHAKLQQGDDWHKNDSVKHWTYVLGNDKVVTCKEKIEAIDERNKTITFILFDGDISPLYKVFKVIFHVIEKEDGSFYFLIGKMEDGSASVNWTIEYETIDENVEPPYDHLSYFTKVSADIDANLLKA